jgi:hypothetical protein
VAPLHLMLFIELGVYLFHTGKMPMGRKQLEHLSHHPFRMVHEIWRWDWHVLIVWGVVAAVAMPLLAIYLRRVLIVLLRRHRRLVRSRPATIRIWRWRILTRRSGWLTCWTSVEMSFTFTQSHWRVRCRG